MVSSIKLMWALLVVFVPLVLAGPVPPNSCATECRNPLNPKFRYAVGHTYTHNFQASSKTWMMGTSDDQAALQVKGQALISFRTQCDAVLQLRQTTISGVDEKVDASELEKRPLLFSWQDGMVDTLCSEESEPVWVVNIKRSVLSMMQHTAQFVNVAENHVMERDIIGRCPTNYTVEGSGQSVRVIKTKIPNQCSERIGRNSSIPTVAYQVPAETQTIPLLNSTSVCRQQIKDGIVQSTECEEVHLFRPLSSENGGARAEVSSSIKLINSANTGPAQITTTGNLQSSTLVLDPRGIQAEIQPSKDVNSVLRAVCLELASDSPARVSQLFTELVHSLRKASPQEVKAAHTTMKAKKICPESTKTEKLFLDALPQAGSTGTIVLMAELLKENQVSERQALGWYMSLPLSKFVSHAAIKAILPLVESESDSPVALLGITGMARRFCIRRPEECQSSTDVQQLSKNLGKLLGNKCQVQPSTPKDEVKIISALKALGNLPVMATEVRNTVSQCAKDSRLPAPIRLAAIEATRSNPCEKEVKENLLAILEDKTEENEIRIAAYQGVMRCPCTRSMLRIQQILSSEQSNQVGSYIKSHLENIKSNPSPGKKQIRRLVEKLGMDRSFPSDLRKYSRNAVLAAFCPINNAGWDIDTNLIYAAKSFIPRSASMNLTLDLFGQSVNLLEIGVRTENLEQLLEGLLGPDVVEKEGVSGLLEKASDSINKFGDNVWNRLSSMTRPKRASIKSNELSNLDKSVILKDKASGIKLDAFLRILGSEVGLVHYRGQHQQMPEIMSGLESKIAEAWRDLIQGAKQVNIDVARSLMFLDSSATFPTVAGFPLRLSINGTTTVGMGLESKMDLPALLRNPLNSDVQLKISPLAVTEISAAMTVDIAVVRTGVKMVATVHSSMAADLSARLQQGSSVEVKLDLPKSKMTLVDLKSELLLIQQSANKDERSTRLNIVNKASYERGGCSERTTFITGLRLCAASSLTIPRPLSDPSLDDTPAFPLSGHGSFSVVLEKSEPTMKGYLISATVKQEGPKASSFIMTLDTPGSKTNRKVSVKGTLTSAPTLAVKVETKAPWGSLNVEGDLVDRDDQKSVQVKLVTQDKREYYGKWQMSISRADRKNSYSTSVEAGWPNQPRSVILEGKFGQVAGSSVEISLKPAGPFASWPLSFQAAVSREMSSTVQKVSLNKLQLITPLGKTILSTEIGRQDRTMLAKFDMKYGTDQKLHSVTFNSNVQSLSTTEEDHSYKTVMNYKSSRFPTMNFDLKWDFQRSATILMSNTLTLVHGQDSEQSTNRLYINQYSMLSGEIPRKNLAVENKLEVTYPRHTINFKLDQSLKLDQRTLKGALLVLVDKNRMVDSDLSLVFVPKDTKNIYELNAKLAYPGRTITLTDTGKRIDANSLSISPVLDIQPGTKVELNGKASYILDQSGVSVNLDSEVRVAGMNSPIRMTHSFQRTGDKSMTMNNKIEWDGQPQLVLNGKTFQRTPTMPAAEISFLWNGRVDAKFDSRLSKTESKIEMDLNLLRLQRRIKINSQHKILGDNRSGSVNVAWDAEKDPSKQVGLEGSLTLSMPQRSVDLKSTLNVQNRLYSTAIEGKLGAEVLNGDHTLRVEVQLPSSKKTYVTVNLSNINQPRKISNRLEVETQWISGNLYQASINNVVSDLDRALRTYSAVTELSLKGSNLEEMKWKLESKRAIKGDKRSVELKSLMIAPRWGQNIDVSANLDMAKDSIRGSSKYQRGTMLITLETSGKIARQGTKINVDGFVELKAPKTWIQQSKVAVVAAYDITSITNFDITEKLSVVYQNTKTITLDTNVKVSPSSADISLMLETPFEAARRQGVTLSGRYEPSNPRSESSLVVMWSSPSKRQPQEARVDLEVERRPGQQLRAKLTTSSPISNFETSELSFDGRRIEDGQVLELDVVAGIEENKVKLTGRLNLNPSQRELDLNLNVPSLNPIRFLGRVSVQPPVYNANTRIDWGTGTLTVEAVSKYISSDNIEASVKINSPELDVNEFEIKLVNKLQKKERTLELTLLRQSAILATVKSVYDRKDSSTGVEITGTAEVTIVEPNLSGSVKYVAESRKVDSNGERGTERKLVVDVTSGQLRLEKLNAKLKLTNKEKSGLLSACGILNACREGSFALKDLAGRKEAHILHKIESENGVELRGIRMKHGSVESGKFEHSVEIVLDEAQKRLIGYKFYNLETNKKEIGLEIYTPKRVSSAVLEVPTLVQQSSRQNRKSQYILTVWLDKIKSPERKLVIATTAEPHKLGEMEGLAITTVVKHPLLPRDLEYKMQLHSLSRSAHVKLDLDSLDTKHQRWILEGRVDNILGDRKGNMSMEVELRSKGAELAALLAVQISSSEGSRSVGANLKLKEKERVVKELFANLNATRQSASLAVGSPAKQLTLEGRWNVDQIVRFSRVQLSGSSRIFGMSPSVVVLDMNTSPHIDVRVFNKASPENYHQISGGLLDDTRFELAMIRQLNVQKKELAALQVQLNSSSLLTTRLNWKVEDIRGLLTAVRSRSQAINNELSDISSSLTSDLRPILAKWRASESMQSGYKKIVIDMVKQLKEMKTETEKDESLKEAAAVMQEIAELAEVVADAVEDFADRLRPKGDLIETITEALRSAGAELRLRLQKIGEVLSNYLNSDSDLQSRIRETLSSKYEELRKVISEVRAKIDVRLSKLTKWVDSLTDNKVVAALKEIISNASWNTVRQRMALFLDDIVLAPTEDMLNELVQNYPELTRIVYRNVQLPIRKIRKQLEETIRSSKQQVSNKPSSMSTRGFLKSLVGEVVVYDLKKGEIRYELPVSDDINSLRDLANTVRSRSSNPLMRLASSIMFEHREDERDSYTLRSKINEIRSKYDPTKTSARMNGQASIIGPNGIITFDKKAYEINNVGCQYVLARDFLNKDFAVVVNFDETGKKSIIFTDGVDQVEIKQDQVMINNKPATSLPVTLKTITVSRQGETVVVKRLSSVALRCSQTSSVEFCNLELSPFYSGRTMGLMGTFSSEHNDDWTEPNGKISKDLVTFVNSWKLNKSCKDSARVTQPIASMSQNVRESCDKLFDQDSSELSPCFDAVRSMPYRELCIQMGSKPSTFNNQMKNLVAGYKTVCQRSGISL